MSEVALLALAVRAAYDVYNDLGKNSEKWIPDTKHVETRFEFSQHNFRGYQASRITSALATLKKWKRWLLKQPEGDTTPWYRPGGNIFGTWLLEVVKGGPTAAQQVLVAL